MRHLKSMLSRTTLGTSCVGSGLGSFEMKTSSDWSCAGTVELDGSSELSPLGGRRPGLQNPAFSSLWKEAAPLAVASSRRDSERRSQPTFPAGSGMSTLALKQDLIGTTQQLRSYDYICFLKTSALLRYNLHSIRWPSCLLALQFCSEITSAVPWGFLNSLPQPSFYLLKHTVPSHGLCKRKCLCVSSNQWMVYILEKKSDSVNETWHRKEWIYTRYCVSRERRCIETALMKAEVWSYLYSGLFILSKSKMFLRVWCFSSSEISG